MKKEINHKELQDFFKMYPDLFWGLELKWHQKLRLRFMSRFMSSRYVSYGRSSRGNYYGVMRIVHFILYGNTSTKRRIVNEYKKDNR